jgi:hypothetical protein
MILSKKGRSTDLFAERAIEEPEAYSDDELRTLVTYALKRGRQAKSGKRKSEAKAGAEIFRRRLEIVWIFRGLAQRLREHPTGAETIKAVLKRLTKIGIDCSERTLLRDFAALGGSDWLSTLKPFEPDEDPSSPLISVGHAAARSRAI